MSILDILWRRRGMEGPRRSPPVYGAHPIPVVRGVFQKRAGDLKAGQIEAEVSEDGHVLLCWLGEHSEEFQYLSLKPTAAVELAASMSVKAVRLMDK